MQSKSEVTLQSKHLQTIRKYVAEGIPEFDAAYLLANRERSQMLAAIEAWFEYWDDRYDGEPLKDHEIKLLAVLRAGAQ